MVEGFGFMRAFRQGIVFSLILVPTFSQNSEVNSVKDRIQSRSNTTPCHFGVQ